mmetsp:Transcript_56758/g.136335  ORF Transcript_56758/g.136335 Transcript_56758/m.136335 type:complete len:200 (+) Transcript_56758:732-1331(+)
MAKGKAALSGWSASPSSADTRGAASAVRSAVGGSNSSGSARWRHSKRSGSGVVLSNRTTFSATVFSGVSPKFTVSCAEVPPSAVAKIGGIPSTASICTEATQAVPKRVSSRIWQLSHTISSSACCGPSARGAYLTLRRKWSLGSRSRKVGESSKAPDRSTGTASRSPASQAAFSTMKKRAAPPVFCAPKSHAPSPPTKQ